MSLEKNNTPGRVEQELLELVIKINSLKKFKFESNEFVELTKHNQVLLNMQLNTMETYADILRLRLSSWID